MTVLNFRWRKHKLPVVSQGRQWDKEGRLHTLVMSTRERVYELAYDSATRRWSVVMASEDRLAA